MTYPDDPSPKLLHVAATEEMTCQVCKAPPGTACSSVDGAETAHKTHTRRIRDWRIQSGSLKPEQQPKKPPKALVDRVFDFIFGPDEAIDDALDADEEVARSGAVAIQKADYTVEVVWDSETQLFGARLKTKTKDLGIDADGATPGEALAYVGMLIDATLVRRGFAKEKR